MTKLAMLAYLDSVLSGITSRGLVASGATKGRLREDFRKVTEIRAALERHVPADPVSATQPNLFNDRG